MFGELAQDQPASGGVTAPIRAFDAAAWKVLGAVVTAVSPPGGPVYLRQLEALMADLADLLEVAATATH